MAKSNLLLALLGKGKPKPEEGDEEGVSDEPFSKEEESEPDVTSGSATFDAAADSLMQAMGVPEGRRGTAKAALKRAIKACSKSGYSDEEE